MAIDMPVSIMEARFPTDAVAVTATLAPFNITDGPEDSGVFPDGVDRELWFLLKCPLSYAGGSIDVNMKFYAEDTSGNVVFGASICPLTPNSTNITSLSFGAEATQTIAVPSNVNFFKIATCTISGAGLGSIQAGQYFWLKIRGTRASGSDTADDDVFVTEIHLAEA